MMRLWRIGYEALSVETSGQAEVSAGYLVSKVETDRG